jgi:hypothetical protein
MTGRQGDRSLVIDLAFIDAGSARDAVCTIGILGEWSDHTPLNIVLPLTHEERPYRMIVPDSENEKEYIQPIHCQTANLADWILLERPNWATLSWDLTCTMTSW